MLSGTGAEREKERREEGKESSFFMLLLQLLFVRDTARAGIEEGKKEPTALMKFAPGDGERRGE